MSVLARGAVSYERGHPPPGASVVGSVGEGGAWGGGQVTSPSRYTHPYSGLYRGV